MRKSSSSGLDKPQTMIQKVLYRIIWLALVFIATLYDALRLTLANISVICSQLMGSKSAWNVSSPEEVDYLKGCRGDWSKVPRHLSIVIGSERISTQILSKIAFYALICDIDYVSIYDIKGQLTLDDVKMPLYASNCKMSKKRFIWSIPGDKHKTKLLHYKNGFEKSLEVSDLSYNEGVPLLAEICKEFYENRDNEQIKLALEDRNILNDLITKTLRERLGDLPDVDLAVVFEKHTCTFGLLPWHTGFTEFYTIPEGKTFDVHKFTDILYKFSKCEQRFGK